MLDTYLEVYLDRTTTNWSIIVHAVKSLVLLLCFVAVTVLGAFDVMKYRLKGFSY